MNKNKILKVIKEYNKIRSPVATATLVKIKDSQALIKFSGPFCNTCGVSDYFDDFAIEAENENLKLTIKNIKQIRGDSYIVGFKG